MGEFRAAPPELVAAELPAPVLDVLRGLKAAGHEAWLVGGAVRDVLLGRPVHEHDLATSATPEEVTGCFPHVVPTGIAHGTVTVVTHGIPIEVTTFRGEGAYHDGRRPSAVVFHRDLLQDLARRDLTINAMAFDPIDRVFADPFGGRGDLGRRLVRAVGEPSQRFGEDGLRVMRAVRVAAVLGFRLDRETRRAIPGAIPTFRKVAIERVQAELGKLVLSPHPRYGIELMRRTGLLAEVLPELLEGFGMRQNRWHRYDVYHHVLHALDRAPARLAVRLAVLLHDIDKPRTAAQSPKGAPGELSFYDHERSGAARAKELLLRLRFPNKLCDEVALLVREHQFVYSDSWSDGAVRRMLSRVGEQNFGDLLDVRRADVKGRGRAVTEGLEELDRLDARVRTLLAKKPALSPGDLALDGRAVMAELGVGPGRHVGDAIRMLLDRVLDDPALNTPEGLRALLAAWKSRAGGGM